MNYYLKRQGRTLHVEVSEGACRYVDTAAQIRAELHLAVDEMADELARQDGAGDAVQYAGAEAFASRYEHKAFGSAPKIVGQPST